MNNELIEQIKANVPLVYEAGYNKCLKENPPGASEEELQEKYEEGYNSGHEDGKTEGLDTAINLQEEFLADKPQTYYDAFWDIYQLNGSKTFYPYAFAGTGWRSETFKPKYPIAPIGATGCEGMFYYFARIKSYDNEMIDFTEINKILDFSGCTKATNTFRNACIKNLYCDFSNCTQLTKTFATDSGGMIDFITLKVSEKATSYTETFSYASSLTDLKFTEDSVIAGSINLQWSKNLNKASIENIISVLSKTTNSLTITLSSEAVNNAFTPEEWEALEATKTNWHISLVQGG